MLRQRCHPLRANVAETLDRQQFTEFLQGEKSMIDGNDGIIGQEPAA